MLDEKNVKLSKFYNNLIALLKILLTFFLFLICLTGLISMFEVESYVPFYNSLNDFFTNLCYKFYTPTHEDLEDFNALMYVALVVVFLLFVFDVVSDTINDLLKAYERSLEEAVAFENEKVNLQIQKDYKNLLKTSMHFVVMLKLFIKSDIGQNIAFVDPEMTKRTQEQAEKMIKEVNSILSMTIDCPVKNEGDVLMFTITDSATLNKVLYYILNVCQVEKYEKLGLSYYMAVATFMEEQLSENAINDAKKLLEMKINKKILCYQVVSECLNTLTDSNFKAVGNGEYTKSEESIYELVNRN